MKETYGVIFVIYIAPVFWLAMKQLDARESIEARRKLYPGRNFEDEESKYMPLVVIWIMGMIMLSVAYSLEWPPLGAVLSTLGILVLSFVIKAKLKL